MVYTEGTADAVLDPRAKTADASLDPCMLFRLYVCFGLTTYSFRSAEAMDSQLEGHTAVMVNSMLWHTFASCLRCHLHAQKLYFRCRVNNSSFRSAEAMDFAVGRFRLQCTFDYVYLGPFAPLG